MDNGIPPEPSALPPFDKGGLRPEADRDTKTKKTGSSAYIGTVEPVFCSKSKCLRSKVRDIGITVATKLCDSYRKGDSQVAMVHFDDWWL